MIKKRHWMVGSMIAVLVHLVAFTSILFGEEYPKTELSAVGVEIDLGLLGELPPVAVPAKPIEKKVELEPEPKLEKPLPKLDVVKQEAARVEIKKIVNNTVKPKKKHYRKLEVKKPIEKVVVARQVAQANSTQTKPTISTTTQGTKGQSDTLKQGGNPEAERSYYAELLARLERYKRYPKKSRKRHEEGVVTVYLTINRDGSLVQSNVSKSSGHKRLDKAVMDMLRKAAPLPKFHDDMNQTQLSINIPIIFELTRRT